MDNASEEASGDEHQVEIGDEGDQPNSQDESSENNYRSEEVKEVEVDSDKQPHSDEEGDIVVDSVFVQEEGGNEV